MESHLLVHPFPAIDEISEEDEQQAGDYTGSDISAVDHEDKRVLLPADEDEVTELSFENEGVNPGMYSNHSLAVNHAFLAHGASGARFASAPPTTTPSANATHKE